MRNRNPAIACPQPARGQAQNAARLGIHTQHRVQQNTASRPLADLAQTATALPGRREIYFAGILDRQNLPARAALRKFRAPAIEQRLSRHALIGQKARKSDNPTASATRRRQMLARATIPASSRPPFLLGARLRNRPAPGLPKSSPAALHSR